MSKSKKSENRPMLGARQLEVLVHVAVGDTYQQAADALGISVNTVRNSLRRIVEKLGASGRAHAVTLGFLQDLLDSETLREIGIPKGLDGGWKYGTLFEQVVTYVSHGYINKEIGLALGVSEQTVKNFVRSITKELGARNRAHIVTIVLISGLLNLQCLK